MVKHLREKSKFPRLLYRVQRSFFSVWKPVLFFFFRDLLRSRKYSFQRPIIPLPTPGNSPVPSAAAPDSFRVCYVLELFAWSHLHLLDKPHYSSALEDGKLILILWESVCGWILSSEEVERI